MSAAGQSVDREPTAARALGDALANAADWQGCVDVDAILRDLAARGWQLVRGEPEQ